MDELLIGLTVGLGIGIIIGITITIKCIRAIVVRTVSILRGGK